MARKIYVPANIGKTVVTNLLPEPSAWTRSGGSVSANKEFVFNASSGTQMFSYKMPAPTAGHIYYIRCMMKAPVGSTFGDGRFEYYRDDANLFSVFARNYATGNWEMASAVGSFYDTGGSWQIRNFTVTTNQTSYRKDPMLIDLTLHFGAGKEPTKEWCDRYIPSFYGNAIVDCVSDDTYARRGVKAYFAVPYERPAEEDRLVDAGNINGYFNVTEGEFSFIGNGTVFSANNIGVISSSAVKELTALTKMHQVRFRWKVKSEDPYDRFAVTVNGASVIDAAGTQEGQWSGSLNTGDVLRFVYTKDVYGDVEGECAQWTDMVCRVDSSDTFITEHIARRVRKMYIGDDDDDASLFFGTKTVSYHGELGAVTKGTEKGAGSNKAAAFFAGGYRGWREDKTASVDAFDGRLIRHTVASLPNKVSNTAGATAGHGKFVVFAGGDPYSTMACAYDEHLTQTIPAAMAAGVYAATPASFKGLAVFCGGVGSSGYVQSYDGNLVRNAVAMSTGRRYAASAIAGDRLLVGGGTNGTTHFSSVDVYDENMTRTSADLLEGRYNLAGGSAGEYGLFLSGMNSDSSNITTVDAFDENLTRYRRNTLFTKLRKAVEIDGMLLVTNGTNTEVWDDTLTVVDAGNSGYPIANGFGVAAIGDYMLIGGGNSGSSDEQSSYADRTAVYKVK